MNKNEFYGLAAGGDAHFVLRNMPAGGAIVAIVPDDELSRWQDNISALGSFYSLPAINVFPSGEHSKRIIALKNLLTNPRGVVLATPQSITEKTLSPSSLANRSLELGVGKGYAIEKLLALLSENGYTRIDFVEEEGNFSRRGEIVDIWNAGADMPWRIVFGYNEIESIRTFDVTTQRSEKFVQRINILPLSETKESYLSDYLPPNRVFYAQMPASSDDVARGALESAMEHFKSDRWLVNNPLLHGPDAVDAGYKPFLRWGGNFGIFISDLEKILDQGYKSYIFCSNQGEKERIEEVFAEHRWHSGLPERIIGHLQNGFYSPALKTAVFSAQEILYKKQPISFPKFKTGRRLEGLWEISPGDYVVHERYGIGRYLGLKRIERQEQAAEYLAIEYKGGDKLYVPIDDFMVVQKYVGLEGRRPKLYSLDTAAWERAKIRAKEGAEKMAQELLTLYAQRKQAPGYAYQAETTWEKELADSFGYTETEDQLRAIEDVRRDLEQPTPMERLICGDVGFGKTEVAIRAALKVAVNSRQVAVLVPTTVLAEQHSQTFSNRLSPFPVRVALLSRFQTESEQESVIADMASGAVDIVIGTHRLLQKDVAFKDLGLLIIDEEHRFGVKQKEKIKSLKKNVDIMMLSATPIPRTLSLALASLRDLSVIESPPYGRLPIETHLGHFDEKSVKRIIEAELSRNGQVFYVHNRVETIFSRAAYLKRLIPGIRLAVIHGQLPSDEIEKAMWEFMHRKTDVLIATTIIESGLDIPSANTMIIEEAENFGLAQLYQLRGRIGREKQKAYCYLFYTSASLTEDAEKRLSALGEFSELGSGFRLALRDLEIRGAGNILGAEQHGNVKDIGFELYSTLLDEASRKLKGTGVSEEKGKAHKVSVDFISGAYIPDTYIEAEDVRIIFYRRLVSAASLDDVEKIKSELIDRFGAMLEPLKILIEITNIKLMAQACGIEHIDESQEYVSLRFTDINIKPEKVVMLAQDYKNMLDFPRPERPVIRLKKDNMKPDIFTFLKEFLLNFKKYLI